MDKVFYRKVRSVKLCVQKTLTDRIRPETNGWLQIAALGYVPRTNQISA